MKTITEFNHYKSVGDYGGDIATFEPVLGKNERVKIMENWKLCCSSHNR